MTTWAEPDALFDVGNGNVEVGQVAPEFVECETGRADDNEYPTSHGMILCCEGKSFSEQPDCAVKITNVAKFMEAGEQ